MSYIICQVAHLRSAFGQFVLNPQLGDSKKRYFSILTCWALWRTKMCRYTYLGKQCKFFNQKNARLVYLITYGQADLSLVPERETFALLVIHAYPLLSCNILQWVCSMEHHNDVGAHYHMAVKLESRRRWLKFRNFLDTTHGIS